MQVQTFENWTLAYWFAREQQQPILARVGGEVGKVFPDGHYEVIYPRVGWVEVEEGDV
jgi:hypothetical protein